MLIQTAKAPATTSSRPFMPGALQTENISQLRFSSLSERPDHSNARSNGLLTLKNIFNALQKMVIGFLSLIGIFKLFRYLTEKKKQQATENLKSIQSGEKGSVTFRQRGNNTCYLLAGLDSLLHHPQGQKILSQIHIQETPEAYQVRFPADPERIIQVNKSTIKSGSHGAVSSDIRIPVIEQAYLQIAGSDAGNFDQPTRAFERIFGWHQTQSESISSHKHPEIDQFIGGVQFPFIERKTQWQKYFEPRPKETSYSVVDILAAIPIDDNMYDLGSDHYFSIRLDQSTPEVIVTANPFDTENDVHQWPIDEFLDNFHIEGIRLPIQRKQQAIPSSTGKL
jgi:hypothetical protein